MFIAVTMLSSVSGNVSHVNIRVVLLAGVDWSRVASELKERCPGVPLMVFARGATYANVALQVTHSRLLHCSPFYVWPYSRS